MPRSESPRSRGNRKGSASRSSGGRKQSARPKSSSGKSKFQSSESRPEKRPSRDSRSGGPKSGSKPPHRSKQTSDGSRFEPGSKNRKTGGASPPRKDSKERTGRISKRGRVPTKKTAYSDTVEAPLTTEKIRLNRFIANSGVCSRREADELIAMGLISVNGVTVTEMGHKVNPGDEVRYENRVLRAEKPVYILLNKPKGFLTTTRDPQERNTVMHLVGNKIKERIYPVGRLDRNTTGLLLLTNDGDLADKLMHPSYNVKKIYKVELDRPLTKADFEKIREGVQLEEGKAMIDDLAIVSDDGRTVGLEIHIGWNRVVRRIFEALDYEVIKLDRSVYAGLDKKDLPRGEWRYLSKEEVVRLKHYR